MPSRGWKLSAAITLVAFSAAAQEPVSAFLKAEALYNAASRRAVQCTLMASTVYAALTAETASAASRLAHMKCRKEWLRSNELGTNLAALELEMKAGFKASPADIEQARASQEIFPSNSLEEVELRIANLRAAAKLGGDQVYQDQRHTYETMFDNTIEN